MFDTSDDQIGSDKKTSSIQTGTTNAYIFLPIFMLHVQQHPMHKILKPNVPPPPTVSLCVTDIIFTSCHYFAVHVGWLAEGIILTL
jgi:hypothetical protein